VKNEACRNLLTFSIKKQNLLANMVTIFILDNNTDYEVIEFMQQVLRVLEIYGKIHYKRIETIASDEY
jgi:hypothetical protein